MTKKSNIRYGRLIYLLLLVAVCAGSAQAQFISSVAHRNTDGDAPEEPEIAPNPLDEDELTFVDRTHQYNEIPEYLIGAQYIKTANDNKNVSGYELDVTMIGDATLYIFIDNRMGSSDGGQGVDPDMSGMAWVATMGFQDTGDDIGIDESGDGDIDQYSSVFSKQVLAGTTITLHGDTEGHGGNMYGVAAMGPKLWAYDPTPEDGALLTNFPGGILGTSLMWMPGSTAVSHDIYFGENFDDVNEGTGGTFRVNQTGTYFLAGYGYTPNDPAPTGFVPGTTYYWRIDEVEADGVTKYTGNVWSFSLPDTKAYSEVPRDGSKFIDPNADLSWEPGMGVITQTIYFGDDYDTVSTATTGGTGVGGGITYDPGPLELETVYYWRVETFGVFGLMTGDTWSFRTLPDIPPTSDPNLIVWWKLDEDSGTTALDWSGHSNHGTLVGDPQWVAGQVGGALDFGGDGDHVVDPDGAGYLNGLNALTVCMWIKSDVINTDKGFINGEDPDGGDNVVTMRYDSDGASFGGTNVLKIAVTSTPGGEQQLESSSNLQVTEWQHVAMTWSDGDLIRFYVNGVEDMPSGRNVPNNAGTVSGCTKLIIGKGSKDEGDTAGWDGLIDDVRIYNKVLTSEDIKEVMRGDPLLAWDASPTNGSTPDIDEVLPLSWSPGDNASQHDVYFGTDKDAVEFADISDTTGIYRDRQSGTSYTPPEGVEWGGGPYYWRIDEYNTDGTISKGRIWSFTVADFISIDNIEGYKGGSAPLEENIWFFWNDGVGYGAVGIPPYSPGNGTGSEVGDLATDSYTEEDTTHGGSQSMPYWYNNNNPLKMKYSEAKLTLSTQRDWTKHDIKALSLWFQGYPASVGSFTDNLNDTYTMTGSGDDIWNMPDYAGAGDGNYHDEFHFAYKTLTGAGTIIARVDSVSDTHDWAKAGVMIRETLDANSPHAFACMTPNSGVSAQGRPTFGAASVNANQGGNGEITAPHWVRLERDMAGSFTVSHSTDGSAWEAVEGATPQNVPMTSTVYVGLALTSHNAALTCEATFSNVTITGTVTGQWASQDIGIMSNDAEPMYVAIANNTGQPAVVYHDDLNAAQIDTWTQWNIDLNDFAGINLADVNSIAIGFGDRNNPQAGGSGKMYFDDFVLYRSRCVPDKVTLAEADLNSDCVVDFRDLEIMTDDWLESAAGLAADLNSDSTVDFKDYAVLTDQWLDQVQWP
jgi:hypothetical protein